MLKYGTTKCSPPHVNVVLVEAWDTFKLFSGNINRDRFVKKLYFPSDLPTSHQHPGMCCLHTSLYRIQGWRHQLNSIMYRRTYQITVNQDQRSNGYPPRKGNSTTNQEYSPLSGGVWCRKKNKPQSPPKKQRNNRSKSGTKKVRQANYEEDTTTRKNPVSTGIFLVTAKV